MNPDLERLVEAFYRLQECEPGEERKLLATYRRLFQDAAARLPPGRSREELQAAIRARARQKSEVMNPFPKVPTRTTDSSQFQPRVEGGKNPDPRCSAVPSAGAPMGAAGTAALPIIKAQMNTAQPAKSSVR